MVKKFAKCSKNCPDCHGCGEIIVLKSTNLYPIYTEFYLELCNMATWVEEKFYINNNLQYRKYKNKDGKLESPDSRTPAVEFFRYDGPCYKREFRKNGRLHSPNDTTPSVEHMDFEGKVTRREFHKYGKFHSPDNKTPAYEVFNNKIAQHEGNITNKLFYKNGVIVKCDK